MHEICFVLFFFAGAAVNGGRERARSERVKGSGTVNEAIKSIRLEVFLFPFFPFHPPSLSSSSRHNGGLGARSEFKSIEVLMMCSVRLSAVHRRHYFYAPVV
jgi:hypothetical protein